MHHFFALTLPDEVRQHAAETADDWRRRLRASWYAPADYHITLKFLGDVPEERQPELIAAALPVAAQAAPVDVRLHGIGVFPDAQRPQVLWVGVEVTAGLRELAGQLETALAALGFRREMRPYIPHITIARIRAPRPLTPEDWPKLNEQTFPVFTVRHFVLMQTLPPEARRKDQPVRYNTVHPFPLGDTHL